MLIAAKYNISDYRDDFDMYSRGLAPLLVLVAHGAHLVQLANNRWTQIDVRQ